MSLKMSELDPYVNHEINALGALLVSDSVVDCLRREIRRLSPDVRIDGTEIKLVLENEIIKREVLDGDKATSARKQVANAAGRTLRSSKPGSTDIPTEEVAAEPIVPAEESRGQ